MRILPERLVHLGLGLALTVPVLGAGCKRKVNMAGPRHVAVGRPENCLNQPMVNDPRGIATPDAIRCSYDDAIGQGMTDLHGSVVGEEESAPGTPLGGMWIALYPVETGASPTDRGVPVAKGSSDPSGHFHITAFIQPGEYLLVARAEPEGDTLAYRRVVLESKIERELRGLTLIVPLDPDLRRDDESTGPPSKVVGEPVVPPVGPRPPPPAENAASDAKSAERP